VCGHLDDDLRHRSRRIVRQAEGLGAGDEREAVLMSRATRSRSRRTSSTAFAK
jgi:hypothetical protein